MSRSNINHHGVKKTPGMESTPVKRTTDSSTVGQHYAVLGTLAAQLGDICSMYEGASWGDLMMERESVVVTPPTTVPRSEISREEFLFRYYIDLATDPCKYGTDLEMEMADTKAELEELGKWADVLAHLIHLEEEKMKVVEERVAKDKEYAEWSAVLEKKRLDHQMKIAAMKEAAVKAIEEDKVRVATKLAARQLATVKSGRACRYFRNNGMPEPAKDGWEAGCGYHKEGKCRDIHPDEPGWNEAVATRKAYHGHHHAPRGGGGFHRAAGNGNPGNWRA